MFEAHEERLRAEAEAHLNEGARPAPGPKRGNKNNGWKGGKAAKKLGLRSLVLLKLMRIL